ncbi:hypothetical protein DB41_DN00080 [Neochlamydia sp. TUME1]|nr:hypothetical protein DB41_DN00080 [Neochlamydia sp. TUME1]
MTKEMNDPLKVIKDFGRDEEARQLWKRLCSYYGRSLAATAMSCFKEALKGILPLGK